MRRYIAILFVAASMLGVAAPVAMADTLVGANVCDVNVLVENDDAASNQCHNE